VLVEWPGVMSTRMVCAEAASPSAAKVAAAMTKAAAARRLTARNAREVFFNSCENRIRESGTAIKTPLPHAQLFTVFLANAQLASESAQGFSARQGCATGFGLPLPAALRGESGSKKRRTAGENCLIYDSGILADCFFLCFASYMALSASSRSRSSSACCVTFAATSPMLRDRA
jgi:hypothetical protein